MGAAGACVLVAIVTVMVVALIVDGDDSAKVNNGQPDATAPVLVVPTQFIARATPTAMTTVTLNVKRTGR